MKKIVFLLMVFVLMMALVPAVLADAPAPGGPFMSAFRVQNVSTSTASCSFTLYNSSGTASYTSSSTSVAAGDSMYVYMGDSAYSGIPSGSYSGVVSCDQQVAAVSNFSDADSGAAYSGITSPATIWYAPGIYDNYYEYYSNIVVQNANASTVNITVDIYAPGNPVPVITQTANNVPAYASATFEQGGAAELSNDVAYSAKITGTGNVAPIVNIYGLGSATNQLYSYNPFSAGATTFYAPVIMNNYYGYNTAIAIQNVGASDANVTVTYASGQTWAGTVPSNSAASLYTPSSGIPSGMLTSATVTSTGSSVVVLVNESNNYNRAASYSGFSSGSTTARAPIVMKRYYSYNTSVTCQNIGSAATTMALQYAGVAGTNTSSSVAVGSTYMFYQPDDTLIPDGFIGSATITASQNIVCVVNEDQNEGTPAITIGDWLYAYNGIN